MGTFLFSYSETENSPARSHQNKFKYTLHTRRNSDPANRKPSIYTTRPASSLGAYSTVNSKIKSSSSTPTPAPSDQSPTRPLRRSSKTITRSSTPVQTPSPVSALSTSRPSPTSTTSPTSTATPATSTSPVFHQRSELYIPVPPPKLSRKNVPSLRVATSFSGENKFEVPVEKTRQVNMSSPTKQSMSLGEGKNQLPMPGLSGKPNGPIGNLLKGPVDDNGKLKDAALMVGIKLDLEAEVHLTARIRGDVLVGLY